MLSCLVVLMTSCSEREPDAQGEFVELYLDPGIQACGGQVAAYDRFVAQAFDLWAATPVPAQFRATIHARRKPRCRGTSCATRGNAWLFGDYGQYHELTHVIHIFLDGESAPALKEGVAEALGPSAPLALSAASLASVDREFLYKTSIDALEYTYAAAFTRYLADRYGVAEFRDYFRTVGALDDPSRTDIDAAFEGVFADTVDDVWPEFISAPRCAYDFWFCGDRPTRSLPYELNGIDCSDSQSFGYDASSLEWEENPYAPTAIIRFAIETDGLVRVGLDHALVYVGRCGDCASQAMVPAHLLLSNDEGGQSDQILPMAAGDYVFIVRSLAGGETRVSLSRED